MYYIQELIFKAITFLICFILTFLTFYSYKEIILIYLLHFVIFHNPEIFSFLEFNSIFDIYFLYIKISSLISLLLFLPIILIQILFFLKPGLYKNEYKKIKFVLKFIIIYFYIFLYVFISKIISFIFNNIYLKMQWDPSKNLGISLDFFFSVTTYYNILFYYLLIILSNFLFMLAIFYFKNIKNWINKKFIFYIFFIFLILIFLPPNVEFQIQCFIIIFFYIEIIHIISIIMQYF